MNEPYVVGRDVGGPRVHDLCSPRRRGTEEKVGTGRGVKETQVREGGDGTREKGCKQR